MTQLQTLVNDVQDWLENDGDDEEVIRAINRAIASVETQRAWEALKAVEVVTPDSDGIIRVPARCRKLRKIYEDGYTGLPDYEFVAVQEIDRFDKVRTKQYKFMASETVTSSLSDGGLYLDVTQNSASISQATSSTDDIDTAWVGERLLIEGDDTFYEITAAVAATSMTVTPDVRRTSDSALYAAVRPIGTEQYKLYDYTGTAFTDDVEVHYQKKHPALVAMTDTLLLPARETVALTAVKFFLHQTKYDVDARALKMDLTEALGREVGQEATSEYENVGPRSTFSVKSRRRTGLR